jgi:hypothetical protein
MNAIHQRHQILASLEVMDQAQREKVLSYIKGLLHYPAKENAHDKLRREGLKQIQQALKETKI